ncbi:hypothetical protein OESDEN_02978 [Oesophagostomum dentatum]|uniref:Uncharacterized protein n=1 Tax=Oesophagostomum dentatum TaxID=61180 RepID=A0A0B1TIG8_OESDE|nr:hypothetical protein OESDEN_02978 [Oesophagostomum dentatum]
MDREERRKAIEEQAREAESGEKVDAPTTMTPQPMQRLVKEEMRVFPGTSSEPTLAQLAPVDHDEFTMPSTSQSAATTNSQFITTPGAIRNTSVPRTSSLYSFDDPEENSPPKVHPPDFQI